MLLLDGEDALHHAAAGDVVLSEEPDDLPVGLDRDALRDEVLLDHLDEVAPLDVLRMAAQLLDIADEWSLLVLRFGFRHRRSLRFGAAACRMDREPFAARHSRVGCCASSLAPGRTTRRRSVSTESASADRSGQGGFRTKRDIAAHSGRVPGSSGPWQRHFY